MRSRGISWFLFFVVLGVLQSRGSVGLSPERELENISYQKPRAVSALAWIQNLEKKRDQADQTGNFAAFKKITDEISATIAWKYGLSKRAAAEEEQLILMHSIARTRHRFVGQRHMLHDRYLGYDRARTTALLQKDGSFKNHMAVVLAIDTMVAKALEDEDFEERWSIQSSLKRQRTEFSESIQEYAQNHERNTIVDLLKQPLQVFLSQDLKKIQLAQELFSVFAPKMTLAKLYTELMVSGGTYKGWTVHNVDSFAEPVILTEEERGRYPGLENYLRTFYKNELSNPHKIDSLFSSSVRAVPLSQQMRDKLDLKGDSLAVEYLYDNCLLERGCDVIGIGPRRFYLTRSVNPKIAELLKNHSQMLSEETVLETYKLEVTSLLDTTFFNVLEAAVKWGIPGALNRYAGILFNGQCGCKQDMPQAIEMIRDAANLGYEKAQNILHDFLNSYAVALFYGQNGLTRNMPKGIDMVREAGSLGYEIAQRNLPILLNQYAIFLLYGKNGLKKDISNAFEIIREAGSLGDESDRQDLPIQFANRLIREAQVDGHKGVFEAINILKEATALGQGLAKQALPILLNNCGVSLFYGQKGLTKDMSKGIEMVREAASLGSKAAQENLPIFLNAYGIDLFDGEEGIKQDMSKGIEMVREAASLGYETAQQNLPILLKEQSAKWGRPFISR